jgi:hypothetical protein
MLRLSDVENDAPVYFAVSQAAENIIDGLERHLLNCCLHFAFGGKRQRFLEIFSRSED